MVLTRNIVTDRERRCRGLSGRLGLGLLARQLPLPARGDGITLPIAVATAVNVHDRAVEMAMGGGEGEVEDGDGGYRVLPTALYVGLYNQLPVRRGRGQEFRFHASDRGHNREEDRECWIQDPATKGKQSNDGESGRAGEEDAHERIKQSSNIDIDVDESFNDLIASRLSGAVRIPTVTYDGMDRVGVDDRWNVFWEFKAWLKRTFLNVYQHLQFETVNELGLMYTWKGSDEKLKPLVLMAHYDVVPAASSTGDRWTYPPFSGHYDGEYIWGRGSDDDKSNLIAMLTVIDALLLDGFIPVRSIILSVGFDEEGGADQSYGARCIAARLLERYGKDGIEMIFDEGVAGVEEHWGTEFSLPATAEKGYCDVEIVIDTAGGHSSTPPDHTAIGYLARAIQAIEDNPFRSSLTSDNPTGAFLEAAAKHAKNMPLDLRSAILSRSANEKVLEYMDSSTERRALVRTSTAVDIISGGAKANALPETARAVVNHRIAVQDSTHVLEDHYISILSPLAEKWNFSLKAFGRSNQKSLSPRVILSGRSILDKQDTRVLADIAQTSGTITLRAISPLEPSPVSPATSKQFKCLTQVITKVFTPNRKSGSADRSPSSTPSSPVIVAPILLTGNTDTKFYWDLTRHIYRMTPYRASHDPRGTRIHTIDERMSVKGLREMCEFYWCFVRTVDKWRF